MARYLPAACSQPAWFALGITVPNKCLGNLPREILENYRFGFFAPPPPAPPPNFHFAYYLNLFYFDQGNENKIQSFKLLYPRK